MDHTFSQSLLKSNSDLQVLIIQVANSIGKESAMNAADLFENF